MPIRNGLEFEYRLMDYSGFGRNPEDHKNIFGIHAYFPTRMTISKHQAAPTYKDMYKEELWLEIENYRAALDKPALKYTDYHVSDYEYLDWD